jgi:hypothetical protein
MALLLGDVADHLLCMLYKAAILSLLWFIILVMILFLLYVSIMALCLMFL